MGERSKANIKISDFKCPICLCLMIKPVTLPCSHELCLACFESNVFQTSLTCPMCRMRISSWARKHAAKKNLVNEELWKQIQECFPAEVNKRLEGQGDAIDDDDGDIREIALARPGDVRKEYEEEQKKIKDERQRQQAAEEATSAPLLRQLEEEEHARERALREAQQAEEAASRELIQCLKAEEEEEEHKREMMRNDEALARLLSEQDSYSPLRSPSGGPIADKNFSTTPKTSTALSTSSLTSAAKPPLSANSNNHSKPAAKQKIFMDKFVGRVAIHGCEGENSASTSSTSPAVKQLTSVPADSGVHVATRSSHDGEIIGLTETPEIIDDSTHNLRKSTSLYGSQHGWHDDDDDLDEYYEFLSDYTIGDNCTNYLDRDGAAANANSPRKRSNSDGRHGEPSAKRSMRGESSTQR